VNAHEGGEPLGRRKNYGFEKRQRQLKKQEKKAEKAERRRLKSAEAGEEAAGVAGEAAEVEGAGEVDPDGDDEIVLSGPTVDELPGSTRAD